MKKILGLLLVILIAAGIAAGCSNQAAKTPDKQETGKSAAEVTTNQADSFPLNVKDAKGVEVTIAKKPQGIISLTLGTDEMLLSIVDKSRIKALSSLSADPGLSNVLDAAKDIPVKLKTEAEKIISLQPDIVFVADWADEKFISQLRDAKLLVYALKTPSSIEEQKKAVKEVARLVGESKKGEEIVKTMEQKLKAVEDKVKTLSEDKRLTAVSLDSFFYTYGSNTTFDDITKYAGVVNLAAKTGINGWLQISKEKIVEMNPDVIFLPSWSYEGFDAKKFAEDFKSDKSLAGVKAVKNGKVFMLPEAHMTSVSQNMVLGVEDVAKAVYPELFK